ncbi:hypothetical protein MBLNU230_g5675t1 [Neophaeotheca triangularis]
MTTPHWASKVTPAQLSFLAIYNPSLGPTDETFRDQVVFYYSRIANEARIATKRGERNGVASEASIREEENEKLRQIGLAQGMVDFARSFSDDEPVDSVETEKSRIVMHELEKGWWILASIDLTRLPATSTTKGSSPKGSETPGAGPEVEYSSREVSPPALLLQQLLQAHHVFLLHQGPSLSDLYVRLPRDKFCGTLERFWTRFARSWDVLLHGNPAVDVFSGLKLSSGGELGFGVGEEEWGSGERDVLEDLVRRTHGMVDLVVSRFGEPAPARESLESHFDNQEALPWLGAGNEPLASDGVIFGGVGALSRSSLRSVSLWTRQIYKYGEYAHGVKDNPNRERRKRRKRNPPEPPKEQNVDDTDPRRLRQRVQNHETAMRADPLPNSELPKDNRPQMHDRVASQDYAAGGSDSRPAAKPSIPPPIVSSMEQSSNRDVTDAGEESASHADTTPDASGGTTLGIPDQYMKYLTFGLSSFAQKSSPGARPSGPRRTSTSSSRTLRPTNSEGSNKTIKKGGNANNDGLPVRLTEIDPIPDGEALKAKIAMQKRQENKGHFVIGLKGDLDQVHEEEDANLTEGSLAGDDSGHRTVLRTLQVELEPLAKATGEEEENPESFLARTRSDDNKNSRTGADKRVQRLRVLVYVHRPFIYCLLFEQRAPSLSLSGFYRDLHRNLVPIHKPLVSSTSVAKVAQRIAASQETPLEDTSSMRSASTAPPPKTPIHELLYDPRTLTVHTSVPNIPEPGTPAAEGIATTSSGKMEPPPWTRIDAMNVHLQILNTLTSTQRSKRDTERMSKTSRGWWVVWMRLPPSGESTSETENADEEDDSDANTSVAPLNRPSSNLSGTDTPLQQQHVQHSRWETKVEMSRIAFLVRKSSEAETAAKPSGGSRRGLASGMFGSLSLRSSASTEEQTGGASAGWGPGALAGGIGIDARKYVEGLLSLNR